LGLYRLSTAYGYAHDEGTSARLWVSVRQDVMLFRDFLRVFAILPRLYAWAARLHKRHDAPPAARQSRV